MSGAHYLTTAAFGFVGVVCLLLIGSHILSTGTRLAGDTPPEKRSGLVAAIILMSICFGVFASNIITLLIGAFGAGGDLL